MALVFGSAGKSAFAMGDSRYKDMLSRIVLPMLSFFLLIPVWYYLMTRGHLLWGVAVAAIYVFSINALEKTGLELKKRITDADTGARAEQDVAEALDNLPDDYYVFHDLEFPGFKIDHVILGLNGIFLVEVNYSPVPLCLNLMVRVLSNVFKLPRWHVNLNRWTCLLQSRLVYKLLC